VIARTFGAALLFTIPLAVAVPVGVIASALLIGVGTPPIVYVFTGLAALISFSVAVRHPSQGMEGCNKIFGLLWSGYAVLWSAVSFEATGGFGLAGSNVIILHLLQPPLAALPFALAVLKVTDKKKRGAWPFLGFWVFLSAMMALCFFPVERGFAGSLLPQSDWLKFPTAGLAIVLIATGIRILLTLKKGPRKLRTMGKNARILAAVFILMGLSWAAARALIGLLN
jgi:hypothetical protein